MRRPALRLVEPVRSDRDAADLARVARGDLDGLTGLFDRHAQALHAFVRRTSPREDADDLVQNVFVRLIDIAGAFDAAQGSGRAWLYGVTIRVAQERRRSLRRLARVLADLTTVKPLATGERSSARLEVDEMLARLSEAKRIALVLAEVEGFTCLEIADMLHIPIGTVWTRLHHARRELRVLAAEPEER